MPLVPDPHLSVTRLLMRDMDAALGMSHAEIKALNVEFDYVTKDQHNPLTFPYTLQGFTRRSVGKYVEGAGEITWSKVSMIECSKAMAAVTSNLDILAQLLDRHSIYEKFPMIKRGSQCVAHRNYHAR